MNSTIGLTINFFIIIIYKSLLIPICRSSHFLHKILYVAIQNAIGPMMINAIKAPCILYYYLLFYYIDILSN